MNYEFKKSFSRDIKKRQNDRKLLAQVHRIIQEVDSAESLSEIRNIRRLKSERGYYRIKHGDFRIGLTVEDDTVHFVRFLHRREIYRYFP